MHQAGIPPALVPEGQVLASRGYLLGWDSVNIIPNNWILSLLRLGPCLLLCFPRKLQEGSQVMLSSLFCLPHTEEAVPLLPGLFFVSCWELQVKELLCPHSLTSKIKSWVMITPMVFYQYNKKIEFLNYLINFNYQYSTYTSPSSIVPNSNQTTKIKNC